MKTYDNSKVLQLTEKERLEQWNEIEELVLTYQQYLNHEDLMKRKQSQDAADILLNKFSPLFKSYITLIKYNQIDWDSRDQKMFISQFINDRQTKNALLRKKTSSEYKAKIYYAFNFVVTTYGSLTEEEILSDLYMCFLTLMKRYKQKGKNFCAYVANSYHFEVSRHIKKQISNPLAVNYKNYKYEDVINGNEDVNINIIHEDNYYESTTGLPDYTWIKGSTCSDIFADLTPFQRKILVKYYLEDFNDRQIGELNDSNIGTINNKRRTAVNKLCKACNYDKSQLTRKRKSGRKANVPINDNDK